MKALESDPWIVSLRVGITSAIVSITLNRSIGVPNSVNDMMAAKGSVLMFNAAVPIAIALLVL